jgi:uncharacterized LabA/DUF88 family protein
MTTHVYIDASNLFYGGEKSLGWKIDYLKLFDYLKNKYSADKIFYFGGVEIWNLRYDYMNSETVPLIDLEKHLAKLSNEVSEKDLKRVHFYKKLSDFGYTLFLKPVKKYQSEDGSFKRKANCDVDMTFEIMKNKDLFERAIMLSGDGDFLIVLKYLRNIGKEVYILSRSKRTAKEIRKFAGGNFMDFEYLRTHLEFEEKKIYSYK